MNYKQLNLIKYTYYHQWKCILCETTSTIYVCFDNEKFTSLYPTGLVKLNNTLQMKVPTSTNTYVNKYKYRNINRIKQI